jgi:hypothetical protein
MSNDNTKASEEQLIYAKILNVGMWLGLAVLTVTFLMYMLGVLPNFIPIEDLPKYWGMKASKVMHELHTPSGWGWVAYVGKGDYLNFVGIAMLAGLTILCYLAIIPTLSRKKDTPYLIIAIVEVAVLLLAASGIMKTGGH